MALQVYSVNDVFKISSENEKKWDSKKKIIKKQAFE